MCTIFVILSWNIGFEEYTDPEEKKEVFRLYKGFQTIMSVHSFGTFLSIVAFYKIRYSLPICNLAFLIQYFVC